MILLRKFSRPQVGIYVLLAGLTCFVGATILAVSQFLLIQFLSSKSHGEVDIIFDYWIGDEGASPSLFELVVTGPVFETMLLLALLYLFGTFLRNRLIICCASAFVWGVAHALINTPINGLPSAWIFFVLSCSVFDWDGDASKQYLVPLGIHSLTNLLAFLIL